MYPLASVQGGGAGVLATSSRTPAPDASGTTERGAAAERSSITDTTQLPTVTSAETESQIAEEVAAVTDVEQLSRVLEIMRRHTGSASVQVCGRCATRVC